MVSTGLPVGLTKCPDECQQFRCQRGLRVGLELPEDLSASSLAHGVEVGDRLILLAGPDQLDGQT